MNKQFESLANIWANRRQVEDRLGVVYVFTEQALQVFAEQIVKESAVELMKLGNSYSECDTDADYMQGMLDSADIIKEHFGIEE